MPKLKVILVVAVTLMMALASSAVADTVSGQGNTVGHRYRGGVPALGDVYYASSVQVNRDPAGEITAVRGAGRITKFAKAARVQVNRVALGTSTAAVTANTTPANSGTATSVISYTSWVAVRPGTCIQYRVRTDYSVRWDDGIASAFSVLSPLTTVCGPTTPPVYATCAQMNQTFPHGVGRPGAVDHTTGIPVTDYYVSTYIYNANATGRDADHDGIACEHH